MRPVHGNRAVAHVRVAPALVAVIPVAEVLRGGRAQAERRQTEQRKCYGAKRPSQWRYAHIQRQSSARMFARVQAHLVPDPVVAGAALTPLALRDALLLGDHLVVETEGDSNIKVGDTVKVGFLSSRCHLFDNSKKAFK